MPLTHHLLAIYPGTHHLISSLGFLNQKRQDFYLPVSCSNDIPFVKTLTNTKAVKTHSTLCNPMNCSTPGSSVHGILQTRILEWVAISFSRESSWPRDWTCNSFFSCTGRRIFFFFFFLPLSHLGSPLKTYEVLSNDCWNDMIVQIMCKYFFYV